MGILIKDKPEIQSVKHLIQHKQQYFLSNEWDSDDNYHYHIDFQTGYPEQKKPR